jgi:hypothetical protein
MTIMIRKYWKIKYFYVNVEWLYSTRYIKCKYFANLHIFKRRTELYNFKPILHYSAAYESMFVSVPFIY